jgi:hypothetical protein
MSVFDTWTCIFPGKMGLSWKRAWDGQGTKEEAEAQAAKNCNVVVVPVQLYDHIKEIERRMVQAEGRLTAEAIRNPRNVVLPRVRGTHKDLHKGPIPPADG